MDSGKRNADLEGWDAKIRRLTEDSEQDDAELEECATQNEIGELAAELAASLSSQLEERDRRISKLKAELGESDAKIKERDRKTTKLAAEVRRLTALLGERDSRLRKLTAELAKCDATIRVFTAELGEQHTKIGELTADIRECSRKLRKCLLWTHARSRGPAEAAAAAPGPAAASPVSLQGSARRSSNRHSPNPAAEQHRGSGPGSRRSLWQSWALGSFLPLALLFAEERDVAILEKEAEIRHLRELLGTCLSSLPGHKSHGKRAANGDNRDFFPLAESQDSGIQEQREQEADGSSEELEDGDLERAELAAELEDREKQIGEITGELAERSARVEELTAELGQRDARIGDLSAGIESRERRIEELTAELEEYKAKARRCLREHRKEEETRAEVTLDPATAHPRLLVSRDERSVRWEYGLREPPGAAERFAAAPCVLGREAFSSGRHCWDVDVGQGQHCAIGVTRESCPRQGPVAFSPEEGTWALQQWGFQSRALTSPPVTLRLPRVPRRIRVSLDYEWGEVRFFDVENQAPIFTFPRASFRGERLRPWFWLELGSISLLR
ncbi:E3 ubiquitin-protein ligase TRIM7-like [Strigops habroptila]|uniref:E3 ubiquitin-protein ligase TRIM7-like n=1 Tax=Strigops habroptila TaxID=2489341 RepID=UPI0011CF592E|nr:E3 ubiquitin-protein ligase TRIM7-like [Strigops habroptila]